MIRGEFWYCNACNAQNHETDGECQYCDCGGAECVRDNCSGPAHPGLADDEPPAYLDAPQVVARTPFRVVRRPGAGYK